MPLKDAKSRILARRLTLDLARHKIGVLARSAHLLRLFEQMFPDEFHAPAESAIRPTGSLELVPVWLERFFDLVREELFPLPDFYLDYDELDDWLRAVPFWPLLPDAWEVEVDELPTYYKFTLALLDYADRKAILSEHLGPVQSERFMGMGANSDATLLKRMCERADGPLKYFIFALDVVTRSTGNEWIDLSPEDCGAYEFEWTAETLSALSQTYKEADEILVKVHAFSDWLDEDTFNIETACAFWMKATGDMNDNDAQMILTIDGVPLLAERAEFQVAGVSDCGGGRMN